MTLDEFLKLPGAKVHDGSGCPVALDSAPAVYFRDGFDPSDRGVYPKAGEWIFPNCGHDLWVWNERQSPADIIAYREAP